MNVDKSPAKIVCVPPNWTFGAALGNAFPLDRQLRCAFDECLSKLDPRGSSLLDPAGPRPSD